MNNSIWICTDLHQFFMLLRFHNSIGFPKENIIIIFQHHHSRIISNILFSIYSFFSKYKLNFEFRINLPKEDLLSGNLIFFNGHHAFQKHILDQVRGISSLKVFYIEMFGDGFRVNYFPVTFKKSPYLNYNDIEKAKLELTSRITLLDVKLKKFIFLCKVSRYLDLFIHDFTYKSYYNFKSNGATKYLLRTIKRLKVKLFLMSNVKRRSLYRGGSIVIVLQVSNDSQFNGDYNQQIKLFCEAFKNKSFSEKECFLCVHPKEHSIEFLLIITQMLSKQFKEIYYFNRLKSPHEAIYYSISSAYFYSNPEILGQKFIIQDKSLVFEINDKEIAKLRGAIVN